MDNLKLDRRYLKNQGIKPQKKLGQNFLSERGIIQKLLTVANIKSGETILEIGPGTGNLTAELAKTGNPVIAVEKDPRMVKIFQQERFLCVGRTHGFRGSDPRTTKVELIAADILKFDETQIDPPYKIVANLPFYLTAPVIRKFLESANPPLLMAIIVQKEVAQRICAKPPQMSLLAVSTQFYADTKIIGRVSKNCFWPRPKVDAAILRIVPLVRVGERADKQFIQRFFKIVKVGFSHRRKQLAGNLAEGLQCDRAKTENWLRRNNIQPNQRAETLAVDDWIRLACTFDL